MEKKARVLDGWKWNYFQDNLSTLAMMKPPVEESIQCNKKLMKRNTKVRQPSKNSTQIKKREELVSVLHEHPALRENSFYADFGVCSITTKKTERKKLLENSEYVIKETDLLSDVETMDAPTQSTAGRICDIKETSLLLDNDDDKETCLTERGDGYTEEYNKAYLNLDGRDELEDLHKGKEEKMNKADCGKIELMNGEIFGPENQKGSTIKDFLRLDRRKKSTTDDLEFEESGYFETNCYSLDSDIFPSRETKYFQDIASDFFDEDEDENPVSTTFNDGIPKSLPFSSTPLLPNKTGTTSNRLLRSTIYELERALSDSNNLLAQRDEKMQVLRMRNTELKARLGKEVERNKKMKQFIIEKDKIILNNKAEIEKMNNKLEELTEKLSTLCAGDVCDIQSGTQNLSLEKVGYNGKTNQSNREEEKEEMKMMNNFDSQITVPHQNGAPSTYENWSGHNRKNEPYSTFRAARDAQGETRGKEEEEAEHFNDNKQSTATGNELTDHLRIKFLRDAFFYYMIGFHPDEQIDAISAILEYDDRRQEFVMDAQNMRKMGKKFNISQVFKGGSSIMDEQQI